MSNIIFKLSGILSEQFGIRPKKLIRAILALRWYLRDLFLFRRYFRGDILVSPCLHDRVENVDVRKNEYFWQDLLVAHWIFLADPKKHVDVGSRLDGFVGHVASFRQLEVFDIRPPNISIPRVCFRQIDFMSTDSVSSLIGEKLGYCDSVSCLHVLEHLGLGRYGDPVDCEGYKKGIKNLSKLLVNGGTLYLSTPIGRDRVEFNANYVFDPLRLVSLARENWLCLVKCVVFTQDAGLIELNLSELESPLGQFSRREYALAIMVLKKNYSSAESSKSASEPF